MSDRHESSDLPATAMAPGRRSVFTMFLVAVGAIAASRPFDARAAAAPANSAATLPPIKVVYHLTEGIDQAARAMGNVRNHISVEPGVHIVVVSNSLGIDFMLDGAKDKNGNPFDATVEDLVSQGVEFRVCRNTLQSRGIDPSRVISEGKIVPSGVAEVAHLEAREGFVYLRP
jgi:intracellular sulfur oxidation DsrE/DsrF family protein